MDEMKAKIDSPQGKQIYARRLAIVEPVVCQHLCAQTHEPIHVALKIQGGCTMEIVRSGAQYRQNPHFWGASVAPWQQIRPIQTAFCPRNGPVEQSSGAISPREKGFFDSLVRRLWQETIWRKIW